MAKTIQDIQLSPYYHEAKNEIVQPNHFVACSRYFVQKWIPELGGTAVSLVLFLRSLGYYNPLTGERRDGIQVSLKEIAQACGCSDRTIQRELEKNDALRLFVQVEPCYERSRDGRVQRLENIYRIAMDDPLAPEDEPRLAAILAERHGSSNGIPPTLDHPRARPGSRPRKPPSEKAGAPIPDNLSLPSRQSVATPVTSCPGKNNSDKLSPQKAKDILPEIPDDNPSLRGAARASRQADALPPAVMPEEAVVVALCACGVSRKMALQIASEYAEEAIQQQIAVLPYRNASDPAAVLVTAIRQEWAVPAAYFTAEKEREERVRRLEEAERAARERQAEQKTRTEMESRLQAYWETLPPDVQESVEQEAREGLRRESAFLARVLESGAHSEAVQQILMRHREQILLARIKS